MRTLLGAAAAITECNETNATTRKQIAITARFSEIEDLIR